MDMIASLYPLGLLIGSILWGVISDKYGRMHAFKNTILVAAISSIGLVFSPHCEIVAICLFFLAIGQAGEISLGGTVFLEFCPPSKRYYLTMMSLFLGLGAVSITLVGYLVVLMNSTNIHDWRYIIGFGSAVEVILLGLRFSMMETPAFCAGAGDYARAEKILNIISLRNTGKEFIFNNEELQAMMPESENSNYNLELSQPLLINDSGATLLKEVCKRDFLKVSAIISTV